MKTKLYRSDPKFHDKIVCGPRTNYFSLNCKKDINGGRAGGLNIIWSTNVNLQILNHNENFKIVLWHFFMTFLLSITSGGFDMDVTCSRIISFLIE